MRLFNSHKDSRVVNPFFKLTLVLVSLVIAGVVLAVFLGRLRPASLVAYEGYRWTRRDVYLFDMVSSIHLNLTDSDVDDFGPLWNANGSRLTFHSFLNSFRESITALELGTFTISTLSGDNARDDLIARADWAAGGQDHAFMLGYGQMWISRRDSQPAPVGYGFSPSLSPNGHYVLYYADSPGALNAELYLYEINGKRVFNLSQNRAHDWSPAWSPDGTQVAFLSTRDGNAEIYALDVACAFDRTCNEDARRLTYSRESELNPTWSPDGREVLYVRDTGPTNQLFVLDVASGAARQLTSGSLNRRAPVWKP